MTEALTIKRERLERNALKKTEQERKAKKKILMQNKIIVSVCAIIMLLLLTILGVGLSQGFKPVNPINGYFTGGIIGFLIGLWCIGLLLSDDDPPFLI